MLNPTQIETKYQELMQDFGSWPTEGILHIDLEQMHALGLLADKEEEDSLRHPLTHYFHVIETAEKITLFNDQFIVWIVPQLSAEESYTLAIVALIKGNGPEIELAFTTSGVYNTSKIVLQVLERFLEEIQENEEVLSKLNDPSL